MDKLDFKYLDVNERIAWCKETKAEALDLSGLGLWVIPEELGECGWLRELDIGSNQLSDLSGLSHTPELRELIAWNNQLSDLSGLSHTPELRELNVGGNQLSDLSGLSHTPELRELNVGGNQLSDLSGLSHTPELRELNVGGNQLSDLSGLSHTPELRELNVGSNQLSDLSGLSHTPELRKLNVGYNQLSDLSGLSHTPELRELNVGSNQLSDLSGLSHTPELRELNVQSNQLSDLSGLSHTPELRELIAWNNQLSDLSGLSHTPELRQLNVHNNQLSDLSGLSHTPELRELNVGGNQLSDLSGLSHTPELRELNVGYNQLSDLSGLSHTPELRELNVRYNQLSDLSGLSHTPELRELIAWDNQLSDLSGLAHTPELRQLNVRDNQLSGLSGLAHTLELRELDVGSNQLSDLSGLAHTPELRELDVGSNQLSDLSGLAHTPELRELNVHNNQLSDLSGLSHTPELRELDVGGNELSDLSGLSHTPELRELNVQSNQLSDLSGLSHTPELRELNVQSNQLSDLSGLAHTPELRELNVQSNQLSDLSGLAHTPELRELNVGSNQLSDLSGLSHTPELRELDVGGNELSDLSGLSHTTELRELNVGSNQLSDLSGLSHTPELRKLIAWNNQLSDLSGLSHTPELRKLDVRLNQLSDLSGLAHTPELRELNVGYNQLSDLSGLAHTPELRELYVQNNQLSDLSGLLKVPNLEALNLFANCLRHAAICIELKNLKSLSIGGNPLETFPAELAGTIIPSAEVVSFFRSWQQNLEQGAHDNRLFKLQVCGNGTVGKTVITRRLMTGEFHDTPGSTDGVQIQVLPQDQQLGQDIQLVIWDFGGQDIYHQMHRVFLKDRSICLLVFDEATVVSSIQTDPITKDRDLNRPISYWISDIKSSAPDATLLLVQNKVDENDALEIDLKGHIPEGVQIDQPLRLSAKTGRRFHELPDAIIRSVRELPSYKMKIPTSWWKVREAFVTHLQASQKKKEIAVQAFNRLCRLHGVRAGSEEALLTYLDRLGILMYDKELFPEQVILDQQWALDAIYTILRRFRPNTNPDNLTDIEEPIWAFQQQLGSKNGQFIPFQLPFKRQGYTQAQRDLFLKIMLRAGICFKTNAKEHGQDVYVLFHFLPKEMPKAAAGYWRQCLLQEVIYQRYKNEYFLHKDIFRQLVKRISDHVDLEYLWQDGLLLKWRDTTALLTVHYGQEDRFIQIAANGRNRETILQTFRNVLNEILIGDSYFTLQASSDGTTFFEKDEIADCVTKEAKKARAIDGSLQTEWQQLKWCLREEPDIRLKDAPKVRHETEVYAEPAEETKSKESWRSEVIDLIAEDKLKEALQLAFECSQGELQSSILILQRRHSAVLRDGGLGTRTTEEVDKDCNKIVSGAMRLLRGEEG